MTWPPTTSPGKLLLSGSSGDTKCGTTNARFSRTNHFKLREVGVTPGRGQPNLQSWKFIGIREGTYFCITGGGSPLYWSFLSSRIKFDLTKTHYNIQDDRMIWSSTLIKSSCWLYMPETRENQPKPRQYPGIYEKAIPIAIALLALVVIAILVYTLGGGFRYHCGGIINIFLFGKEKLRWQFWIRSYPSRPQ